MKAMKKLMALALVLTMVLALAISASAASIEITNPQTDLTEEVYQMATYVSDGSGNSWYKANDAWKPFLQIYFNIDSNGFLQDKTAAYTSDAAFATALKEWMKDTTNYASVSGTKVADLTSVVPGYYALITKNKDGDIMDNVGAAGLTDPDGTLTISQKNTPDGLPQVNKEVTGLGTDYKVGDIADFKITITCQEGKTQYIVHDQMTGLALEGAISVSGSNVKDFTINNPGTCDDKCTFEIVINFDTPSKAYDKVEITYKAKVTETGIDGVKNEAWIDNKSDSVIEEKKQYTITKTDASSNQISGAEFELYVGDAGSKTLVPVVLIGEGEGAYYRPATASETPVKISAGKATIKGLDKTKTYYLLETKAPAGYVALADYIQLTGDQSIQNTKASELPSTGGMGTTMFYVVGAVLVVAAVALVATKKRYAAK